MPRGSRAAALLCGLWLAGASVALAQSRANKGRPRAAVVAVGLDSLSQTEALRLGHVAEQAVVHSERFELVSLSEALDPGPARERQGRLEDAEAAFQAGMAAYDALDTQKAVGLFDKAVRAYEGTDLTRNFAALSRAWVMRIASHVANGETQAARTEIDRLVPLNPKAEFSPRFFPPEELARVDRVRRGLAGLSTQSLTVKTGTVSGRVYVDGVFRGISPLTVSKLPPADHYVTVTAPGFSLKQEKVRDGSVQLVLQRAEGYRPYANETERIAQSPDGAARDSAARALAQEANADQVVLAIVQKSSTGERLDVTALRIDAADGHNLGYARRSIPLGESSHSAADSLFSEIVEGDAARVDGVVTHFEGSSRSPRKTAGYVLLGTGAALLAGAAATGIYTYTQWNQYNSTVHSAPGQAANFKKNGEQFAVVSDVFSISGVVVAGTGALLSLIGGNDRSPAPEAEQPVAPVRKSRRASRD